MHRRNRPETQWRSLSPGEATPKNHVLPTYPVGLKAAHVTGTVKLQILISRTGTIKDIEPLYAPAPELMQAAIDAVRQWTYAPILREGKPIETITSATVNFDVR